MKTPQPKAREITPDEWLQPPVNHTLHPTEEVLRSNEQAAKTMNRHKDEFLLACLHSLIPRPIIGEVELEHLGDTSRQKQQLFSMLDPAKINLTIRPRFNPVLLIPGKDNTAKALCSQCADVLEFTYNDLFIGSMEFSYEQGRISITATLKDPQ